MKTCLADYAFRLYKHSQKSNPSIFLECKIFWRPIFFVFICITRTVSTLQRLLCSFSIFLSTLGRFRVVFCLFVHLIGFFPTLPNSSTSILAWRWLLLFWVYESLLYNRIPIFSTFYFLFLLFFILLLFSCHIYLFFSFYICMGKNPIKTNWYIFNF